MQYHKIEHIRTNILGLNCVSDLKEKVVQNARLVRACANVTCGRTFSGVRCFKRYATIFTFLIFRTLTRAQWTDRIQMTQNTIYNRIWYHAIFWYIKVTVFILPLRNLCIKIDHLVILTLRLSLEMASQGRWCFKTKQKKKRENTCCLSYRRESLNSKTAHRKELLGRPLHNYILAKAI